MSSCTNYSKKKVCFIELTMRSITAPTTTIKMIHSIGWETNN